MISEQQKQLDANLFDGGFIDLGQYLQTIKRYFWRILGLTVFLTILAALVVLSMKPTYTAKVSLLIEADQANVLSIEEVYGLDSSRKEYFETQYQILRSRQIAETVVDNLNLVNEEYFDLNVYKANKSKFKQWVDELTSSIRQSLPFLPQKNISEKTAEELAASRRSFAVSLLMKSTTVKPVKNTQVVEVLVHTPKASLSSLIANETADVYIESYLEAKLEMTEKATSWLNESLQGLRSKLDNAEAKLANFYEENQVVDIDGVVGLASEQVQQLSSQLLSAQISMQRAEVIFNQVNNKSLTLDEIATLPEVLNHPSIQSLKREEIVVQSEVSELGETYGPKHPRMISIGAELSSIQQSINEQINNLVSGINTEYESVSIKVDTISKDLDKAKSELRKLANLDNKRKVLQRDVDINQQLYDSFFTRLNETDQLGGFESANARILDSAKTPGYPSKPRKSLLISAAFILSFGFGAFMSLVLEALNSGIRSVEDVERKLGQRMLGIIPWEPHKKKEHLPVRHFFDPAHHLFSESVRTLRTSLQLLNLDKPSKTILVTSSVPKEGKSTVSVNLAFALGQLNRVLLIDTDLRRPSIGRLFSLPGFQPGVANIIAGTHSLEECVVKDEESGIEILAAGTLPPNPQELLASDKFAALMEHLKRKFDCIVVDSAPTQAVSDAIVVSKQCDSLVYVVKSDSTSSKSIQNGLSRFVEIGHRIDGVVLNQVDLKKARKTGEYSGFYDQYGYNSQNAVQTEKS